MLVWSGLSGHFQEGIIIIRLHDYLPPFSLRASKGSDYILLILVST